MIWRVILLGVSACAANSAATLAAERQGVADRAPVGERSVEHGGRYLVRHEATIPGTSVRFVMIPITGGRAPQPGPDGPGPDATIAPFWIGRCEVTWAEYREYMALASAFERFDDLGVRRVTAENRVDSVTAPSKLYDPSFTFDAGEAPELPAVSMSQYAAKQYTKWLSLLTGEFYRLPSEIEWEHAARAGRDGAVATDREAWHADNAGFATHPVAQKAPNAWGLCDTLGNASEWVLDAFHHAPPIDPDGPGGEPPVRWPDRLFPRVLKGGSALLDRDLARPSARRASDDKTWRAYDPNLPKSPWWFAHDDAQDVGFRVLKPIDPPPAELRQRYWEADLPSIRRAVDFRIDEEGRGERGVVDAGLPAAIRVLSP